MAVATSMILSRSVCQGSGGSGRPSSVANSAFTRGPSAPREASVPAAPPNCTASLVSRVRMSPSTAASRPASQPAATTPNVTGTACWSIVRPIMSEAWWAFARCAAASAARSRSALVTSSACRASSIAAVSMMSWLAAPRCTARAAGPATLRASMRASPGTGLPVAAASRPSSAVSNPAAAAALVTSAPAPAGASPARSRARASPASAFSMARSHAASPTSAPPRLNTPPNSPPFSLPRSSGMSVVRSSPVAASRGRVESPPGS